MIDLLILAFSAVSLCALARPLLVYFKDEKNFRQYPGQNWLSGFTWLAYGWEVGRSYDKKKGFHTQRLHNSLMKNPVIRLGPNWLSFSTSQAARDIYGYSSRCVKGEIYASLQGGGKHLVNIVHKPDHSHRRRTVATAYAPKNTDTWEPLIADSMSKLLAVMDGKCTAPPMPGQLARSEADCSFDGVHWSFLFTFEAIVKIGMSKDLHFIEAGNDLVPVKQADGTIEMAPMIDSLHSGSRATATLVWDTALFPYLKKVFKVLSSKYRANFDRGDDWRKMVEQLSEERISRYADGEVLNDLFQPMLEDRKTGDAPDISLQDRVAEVDQMINGGGDGPAVSMICTLYYLCKNPTVLATLRQELDEALSPSDTVAPWYKVRGLRFLRACIDESMRLSPPVATDLLRRTPPGKPTQIGDQLVPGDTTVSVSAYTAHRDPTVFEDPEAYRPERWIRQGDEDERLREMLASFIPFSTGSRGCIGRNVTILEQLVYVATIVHRYDFCLPTDDWEMEWEEYFNLWPMRLPLKIWRRDMTAPQQS